MKKALFPEKFMLYICRVALQLSCNRTTFDHFGDAVVRFSKTRFFQGKLCSDHGEGGGFSAKFRAGVCRPRFQNSTVG